MKNRYQIIKRPIITEKGLAAKENRRTLVFEVEPRATKNEIRTAVESIFKVRVSALPPPWTTAIPPPALPAKSAGAVASSATVRIGKRPTSSCGPGKKCPSTPKTCDAARMRICYGD